MGSKTALIIRHVPHEGIAGFRKPIEEAGYHVDRIDVDDPGFSQVDLSRPDLLIMMGGPMGVYETEAHPWIACQMRRLARRLEAGMPTLGVCLGAQMIAGALGARVYPGPRKEVGFKQVRVNDAGHATPLRHIGEQPVLHWHGDTFDLPPGTELLASTDIYSHQAFRRGRNILALQFHAEMGEDERFDAWIEQWPEAVLEAGQDVAGMRREHDAHGPSAVEAGRTMIAEWLSELEGPGG